MIFDIGPGEFLVIAIVAVLIVGPERLPRMVAEGVKWLRVLRDQAANARREIVAAADFDPAITDELRRSVNDIAELHPRRLAASFLSDVADSVPASPPPVPPSAGAAGAAAMSPGPTEAGAERPAPRAAFDPDAT